MEPRYYFSIRYIPEHADNELLAGRCIAHMHGFISNERNLPFKNAVGISFPCWNEQTVGNVVTYVSSNKDILVGLSYQPYFSTMVGEGLFDISQVEAVPDGLSEVRFIRNQTIAKSFLGSKKRRIARGMKHATETGLEYTPISNEEREFEFFHSIPIGSKTNGNEFVLHVQREDISSREQFEGFSGYGLATNDRWKGTVPLLNF